MFIWTIIFIIILVMFFYYSAISEEKKELRDKQKLEQRIKEEHERIENEIKIISGRAILKEQQFEEVARKTYQEIIREYRAVIEGNYEGDVSETTKALIEILGPTLKKNKSRFKNRFIIYSNEFLKSDISAFYHSDYHGGGNWSIEGSIENMIWTLKNDSSPFPFRLPHAMQQLESILLADLPQILNSTNFSNLLLCVVPRAKKDSFYKSDQLYFRQIINNVVHELSGFQNGTNYIKRHTNTKTTHLGGEEVVGERLPYIGITNDTCTISNEVKDKNILLIDDVYTNSVNIDEDAIQALLDSGAKSVVFYAIGRTVSRF